MDDKTKRRLKLQASMDGKEVIVANIGKKVLVSEMELICLTTFAELGVMSLFAMLDGEAGNRAEREVEQLIERVRTTFQTGSNGNGVERLSESTCAMLRGKFSKYIC